MSEAISAPAISLEAFPYLPLCNTPTTAPACHPIPSVKSIDPSDKTSDHLSQRKHFPRSSSSSDRDSIEPSQNHLPTESSPDADVHLPPLASAKFHPSEDRSHQVIHIPDRIDDPNSSNSNHCEELLHYIDSDMDSDAPKDHD